MLLLKKPDPLQGATAPSLIVNSLFGITNSGSIFLIYPMPLHSVQAPNGLLKENILGAISSIPIPCSGHANFVENSISSLPITSTITKDSLSFNTVSIESANLDCIPSFTTILSTTTSMLCFFVLASSISSYRSLTSPSIRTLTNPSFFNSSNIF